MFKAVTDVCVYKCQ